MKVTSAAILLAMLGVLSGGCVGEDAKQMLDTAKFEELQNNPKHARQLYQRIVDNFPDSPEARHAKERLAALP